jgi:hypothetical protein
MQHAQSFGTGEAVGQDLPLRHIASGTVLEEDRDLA